MNLFIYPFDPEQWENLLLDRTHGADPEPVLNQGATLDDHVIRR
jgi:hypothetical protein